MKTRLVYTTARLCVALGVLSIALPSCTSTPYVTSSLFTGGELLPASEYRELAAVSKWRDAVGQHLDGTANLMEHQTSKRACVDEVLKSLLSWCNTGWSQPVKALPPGSEESPNLWRDAYPSTRDGYVSGAVAVDYFNSLPSNERGGYHVEELHASWDDLLRELKQNRRPVAVPYMLSPIPWAGRVSGRALLALFYPFDRVALWTTQALGDCSFSPYREWFLNGEDDIYECYPHAAIVIGLFQRESDGEEFVLLLEPWGGYRPSFSGRSNIVEAMERRDFEERWRDWSGLSIPAKIEAKWMRMATPGTMLVLRR